MHQKAQNPDHPTELNQHISKKIWRALNRKIWLPKSIYASLPLLYIGLGIYALGAALFLSHWSWIVPYFLILGIICLQAGMIVAAMRWRNRSNRARKVNTDGAGTKNARSSTVR